MILTLIALIAGIFVLNKKFLPNNKIAMIAKYFVCFLITIEIGSNVLSAVTFSDQEKFNKLLCEQNHFLAFKQVVIHHLNKYEELGYEENIPSGVIDIIDNDDFPEIYFNFCQAYF